MQTRIICTLFEDNSLMLYQIHSNNLESFLGLKIKTQMNSTHNIFFWFATNGKPFSKDKTFIITQNAWYTPL